MQQGILLELTWEEAEALWWDWYRSDWGNVWRLPTEILRLEMLAEVFNQTGTKMEVL